MSLLPTSEQKALQLERQLEGERKWSVLVDKQNVELLKENTRLREALKFYAEGKSYHDYDEWSPGTSDVMSDFGKIARKALEESK